MPRKWHVRFGGGPTEKCSTWSNSPAAYPTRKRRSSATRRTPSSCWRSRRRRPRRCTTASSTSAARCPCTAPGPDGSGSGASTKRRSFPSSRWASPPTGAPPRPRSCGTTCPTPWRRAGSRCPGRRPMDRMLSGPSATTRGADSAITGHGSGSPPTGRPRIQYGAGSAATASTTDRSTCAGRGSPTSSGPRRRRSGATARSSSTATPPYRVRGRLCRTAARCWCGG